MSHTKEPWSFSPAENGLEWGVEAGKWGVAICADAPGDGTSEANARRIVACVNACAGIPTDDLERCPSGGLFHLADMANEVVKQRDELLAALNDAVQIAKVAHEYWDRDQDSKVGKYLMALAGNLPGYSALTDGVHKAIASVNGSAA